MSLSAVRKAKLDYVFDTFFDINGDGSIEQNDFELAIENIAKIRNYKAGDETYKNVSSQFLSIWEKLRQYADKDKNNVVTRDEWHNLWAEPLNDEWKQLYMKFMFSLQDTSGDGTIDWEEFSSVCKSFKVTDDDAKKSFEVISKAGDIDIKVYETLWKDYFGSDDAKAAGNSIFGKCFG
jgi:Ca2+-binding EF-hand superfamily protein